MVKSDMICIVAIIAIIFLVICGVLSICLTQLAPTTTTTEKVINKNEYTTFITTYTHTGKVMVPINTPIFHYEITTEENVYETTQEIYNKLEVDKRYKLSIKLGAIIDYN